MFPYFARLTVCAFPDSGVLCTEESVLSGNTGIVQTVLHKEQFLRD